MFVGGCAPTCAWASTKGGCLMSWFIYYSSLYSFGTESLSEQGARLVASKVQWSSFLHPHSTGLQMYKCLACYMDAEVRTQVLMHSKHRVVSPDPHLQSWDLSRVSIILSVLLFIFNGLIVIIYIMRSCDNLVYICNVYNDQIRVIIISIPSNTSHFFMLKICPLF